MGKLACPNCRKVAMDAVKDPDTGLEVDHCPSCDGLWFDAGELRELYHSQKLKNKLLPAIVNVQPGGYTFEVSSHARSCPRCKRGMTRPEVSDVFVDLCPHCEGIWLDAGELNRLTSTYRNKGLKGDERIIEQIRKGHQSDKSTSAAQEALTYVVGVLSSFLGTRVR